MISAILFDIYGTLIDIQTDEASMDTYHALSKWLEYSGIYLTPDQIKWFYHEEFARRLGPPLPKPASEEAFKEAVDRYGAQAGKGAAYLDSDVREVFRAMLVRCCSPAQKDLDHLPEDLSHLFRAMTRRHMFVYPMVRPGLDQIRKSYRLGIVSNAQEAFTLPELDLYGLRPYFETIVLSSEIGVKKPGEKIFRAAMDRLNVGPGQVAFVGNDMFADIMGAGRLGMKTIFIGRPGQNIKEVTPDAVVPDINFREIKSIVDRWNGEQKK